MIKKRMQISAKKYDDVPSSEYPRIATKLLSMMASEPGGGLTLTQIRKTMVKDFGITYKKSKFSKFLRSCLGFEYSKITAKVRKLGEKRLELLRNYLIKYADALAKEKAGTHVLVYMDESYVHSGHCRRYCWHFNAEAEHGGCILIQPKGESRMIIVHAMTKDGLLCKLNEEGEYDESEIKNAYYKVASGIRKKSAEMFYQAGLLSGGNQTQGDYHDNMDGVMFQRWVQTKLLPAFEARYGSEKKMILIMDNAPYHHCKKDGYLNLSNMNRSELFREFDHYELDEMTVTREDGEHTFRREAQKSNYAKEKKLAKQARARWCQDVQVFSQVLTAAQKVLEIHPPSLQAREIKALLKHANVERPKGCNSTKDVQKLYNEKVDADVNFNEQHDGKGEICRTKGDVYDGNTYQRCPKGPSADEMRKHLHGIVSLHPKDYTRLLSAMDILRQGKEPSADGSDPGWASFDIIWTPPYCPQVQPIELLWAYVKNRIARDWYTGRNMKGLLEQLFVVFYGGDRRPFGLWENALVYKPVDGELCQKIVGHTHKECQILIDRDEFLGGTIERLTFNGAPATLADVTQTPIELQVTEILADSDTVIPDLEIVSID